MIKNLARGLVLLTFIGLIIAFYSLGWREYLRLEYLKEQQSVFAAYYAEHQLETLGIYFAIYVMTTALSVPGATVLTLAAGALFGVWTGLAVVALAATLGATLAFLATRFILRDTVQKRLGDRLNTVNEGIRKEGAFYLLTLRLVPLFPFFVINLVMGLTSISVLTFFWVSLVGMVPGTLAYVNAGTQLAQITSLSGILSPRILASFVALGAVPFVAKKVIELLHNFRALRRWPRPKRFDYNLIVIGAGSGGLVAAYIAAAVKAKVALIEKSEMGGDCLNTGCVPSKTLIKSAKVAALMRRASEFGVKATAVEVDFAAVMDRVRGAVETIAPHDSVKRYQALGVDCVHGEGRLNSPYEVQVSDRKITARNIIIATGGAPIVPDIPGINEVRFYTSETIWSLRERPKRLLVLGGGAIGCELAQAFQRLGSQVTIVERSASILGREDSAVSTMISEALRFDGVEILTSTKAVQFRRDGERDMVRLEMPVGSRDQAFDAVLLALGRRARTSGFGLEELGVKVDPVGTLEHDKLLRTSLPNVYCVGDVAGPYQLTHVASHQAWYAAVNALFEPWKTFKADYRVIPRVTYTDPEVAVVGSNERELREAATPFETTTYEMQESDRAIAEGETRGYIKVYTVPGKDKILGVTIVASHAGEIFTEFVTAMKQGLGLKKILGTIHAYPTLAEANKAVAGSWRRTHSPQNLLKYVEKYHAWRRG